MHYHQLAVSGERRLTASRDSTTYDLTSADADLRTFGDLARVASIARTSVDRLAAELTEDADVVDDAFVDRHATVPVDAEEIWAAGVTYQISEQAREEESSMPDMYFDVYDADRPEVFFKATPSRTVEPGDAIGVRGDSEWDVPEPELGIVLRRGEIVGYTVGNDVSSRSIEGENPLYLPQAKVYDRCCSIGPCVVTPEDVEDPHELEMSMTIERDGEVIYDDATNTSEMVRSCDELVSYFTRHNTVPELAVILTGTSLVPEQPFDLQEGDHVDITIEGIGTLSNSVTTV
ncbi:MULTISPECIES: fumarylacetoacetate hydrolase family protein [Haloferax]|jgi:2-dehydro-3-deoxy-D-arabinonate dehydratase|uniref:Probable 2-keto-3-deoxyxylonate dehydratase n=5 Tax=Haloferacaceae TaxID=1644056 RepID=KDXD_HALVD|nr:MULTISPECIES: fumarylacetoacetate hydrolase family protein [Haloferax]D4GP28.1 RecName: Full=Probable 2-keto-3-deoxyxylonate dehydratase; Short=KDXD [Haloferax volcanii DS2]ADE01418.1 2-keto-3-deoxy-D-xylonate dehydratase [Haloferax volcanii DS2]ELZ61969.1 2-keto-3-deoxyxylonate dehydratase [Haloferax sp. ATCC BAA-645]ELZ70887.1 2-keto-3-deoxyxylonate dehydratase [Haloferax sp. ATCC BAA-644]ELZ77509.1 2-keto-3-deoxyxylonate dehydratase [Haloferax lucentense DSM 14919]MBC9988256.1 fumarylac